MSSQKKKRSKRQKKGRVKLIQPKHWWMFALVGVALVGSGMALALSLPQTPPGGSEDAAFPPALSREYAALSDKVKSFTDQEHQADMVIVPDSSIQVSLSQIQLDAAGDNIAKAQRGITALTASLAAWTSQLGAQIADAKTATAVPPTEPPGSKFIPILVYHDPPDNLDQQLTYLEQHHYTAIGLDQVAAAFTSGAALPLKPVVLTFDDGYENQMQAFSLLQKHHMKATFYIINGGLLSNWCIGAGRQYHLPSQPPQGCGDAYLTWDQVRQLDKSGLITIGGHTLDHPDLATETPDEQQHEIADSKAGIEQQIGHKIYDFAYPYGSYNDTTISLVKQAGYRTAVTTLPGDYQEPGGLYELKRIRDTLTLP